jgi:hypothetical protein
MRTVSLVPLEREHSHTNDSNIIKSLERVDLRITLLPPFS